MTSIARTVADLAEQKVERGYLADLVADALRKENVRIDDLAEKLEPAARSYGVKTGMQFVSELSAEASSVEYIDELRKRLVHTAKGLEGIEKNVMLAGKQLGETLEPYRKQLDQIAKQLGNGYK